MPEPTFEELLDAMKAGAGALQRSEIPFVLGGGLAAWARGGPITDETIQRAPLLEVAALRVHVFSLEDVMTTKLLALNEQEPDFAQVLSYARALREQIDWEEVRARSEASPFARAFFTLVEGLGIVEAASV